MRGAAQHRGHRQVQIGVRAADAMLHVPRRRRARRHAQADTERLLMPQMGATGA